MGEGDGPGLLPDTSFRRLLEWAPLVAIDLVVTDAEGRLLLGQRVNRPAQNYWFVPGGRIFKGESLDAAFTRITRAELGLPFARSNASLLGVWDHFYDDSAFGPAGDGPNTHYVVLAHHLPRGDVLLDLPTAQHSHYRWQPAEAVVSDDSVHQHSRIYAGCLTG